MKTKRNEREKKKGKMKKNEKTKK
jgi:hypothetical protein